MVNIYVYENAHMLQNAIFSAVYKYFGAFPVVLKTRLTVVHLRIFLPSGFVNELYMSNAGPQQ